MPNRKNGKHWGATAAIKSKAMTDAFTLALEHRKECLVMRLDDKGHYALKLTYFQKDKRHRDLDNLLAASKAHIDGIAKALKIDDKQFQPITINRAYADEAYTLVEITYLMR
jgi:crossover junction endodeoxyribonuclease RusA